MKLPNSVKIGALKIDVKYFDDPNNTDYGEYSDAKSLICINRNLSKQQQQSVFLHEMLHAIFMERGLNRHFTLDQEEIIVNTLEGGIFALMKDNPKLINYLME